MRGIHYRQARSNDIPALIKLMNNQYKRKKNKDYFIWQFFRSEYTIVLIVAQFQNEIVGMLGLQKRILSNNAKIGQVIDMLISPDFRGRGIFSKMINHSIEKLGKIDAICVLPNQNGKRAVEKLGWEKLANINDLILEGRLHESIVDLKFKGTNVIAFNYSEAIINWRFNHHPNHEYYINSIDDSNFTVSKIFEDPITNQKFGDIVYSKISTAEKLHEILINTIKFLNTKGIYSITTWALQHTKEYKVLIQLGFKQKIRERYFLLKVYNSKFDNLYKINNWHLFQADAEMY